MDSYIVLALMRETLYITLILSAPVLLVSLVVGVGIAIVQTTTQIQEQTISFVPKLLAIAITLALTGNWTINVLTGYTLRLIQMMGELGAGR